VLCGSEVVQAEAMMGVPDEEVLAKAMQRALAEGADPRWVEKMRGGKTGVVGIMKFARPGKVVGMRFDMDSNEVDETNEATHRPASEGFRSIHAGLMHACGHDGHVTVGPCVAGCSLATRTRWRRFIK
jgi:aminobenzoyl-glutamate utilization protein A